jgi:hypothetical protein
MYTAHSITFASFNSRDFVRVKCVAQKCHPPHLFLFLSHTFLHCETRSVVWSRSGEMHLLGDRKPKKKMAIGRRKYRPTRRRLRMKCNGWKNYESIISSKQKPRETRKGGRSNHFRNFCTYAFLIALLCCF